jgi:hypothetical protein
MLNTKVPQKVLDVLISGEMIEDIYALSGRNVYATNKRIIETNGNAIRDYDYTHISSIRYEKLNNWSLLIAGLICIIFAVIIWKINNIFDFHMGNVVPIVIGILGTVGVISIILFFFYKTYLIELNVVGIQNIIHYSGDNKKLQALLKVIRDKKEYLKSVNFSPPMQSNVAVDTIKKLGELRDRGLITPQEFEEKKRKLLKDI